MKHSIYIHIPFCRHRCNYCDFVTTAGEQAYIPVYVDALNKEFRVVNNKNNRIWVHSIYFGGGTPSLISVSQYKKLLDTIKSHYLLTEDCEICLEANPGTLSAKYLAGLKSLGFNRISIGVQSTDPFDLKRLDRIHTIEDVLRNIKNIKQVGLNNLNIDLIFGLPWQSLESWKNSLERAIHLHPEHFSLYSLLIEQGTILYDWNQKGLIKPQDQDLEGEMYECAMILLDRAGYDHYEISNWVKRDPIKDYRCRHNLQYWLNMPYLGFGAGAHGYVKGIRMVNTSDIFDYIKRINRVVPSNLRFPQSPANVSSTFVDRYTQMKDFMLLGLRLINPGVSSETFAEWYGESAADVFADDIEQLLNQGLVKWWGDGQTFLRLSKRGVMVANQVFMHFV